MSGDIHGKRGRVGGRSGCGAEVTAAAVGESDTPTDGRPHCHTPKTSTENVAGWVGAVGVAPRSLRQQWARVTHPRTDAHTATLGKLHTGIGCGG